MANVIEAKLRGTFEDAVSASIARTAAVIDQSMTQIESAGGRAIARIEAATSRLDTSLSRASSALVPLSAALAGAGAAAVKFGGDAEAAQAAFASLLKSDADAKQFLADLEAFGARTPFEYEDLRGTAIMLRNMKFETRETIPVMLALGDALAGMPEQEARIRRAALQLGQMNLKGVARAEELIAITEAGIPALDILARKLGVDVPTATKMMEKGMIDGKAAVRVLVAGMEEEFGGKMARVSQTFVGQWSNMKDALAAFGRDLGAVLLPYAKAGVAAVVSLIGVARDAVRWFSALPEPVQKIIIGIVAFTAAIGPLALAFSGVARVVTLFAGPLKLLIPIVANIVYAIGTGMTGALVGAEAAIVKFIPVVATLAVVIWSAKRNWDAWQSAQAVDDAPNSRLAALQRLEQGLRAHGVGIDELRAKYDAGSISIEQYSAALRKLAIANAEKPAKPPMSEAERILAEMQAQVANLLKPADTSKADNAAAKKQASELEKLHDLQTRLLASAVPEREQIQARYAEVLHNLNQLDLKGVADAEQRKQVIRDQAALIRDRQLRELAERERQTQRDLEREQADMSQQFAAEQAAAAQRNLDEFLRQNEVRMESELRRLTELRRARQEELDQMLRNASLIDKTAAASRRGTLGPEIGVQALAEAARLVPLLRAQLAELRSQKVLSESQVEDVLRLEDALQRLNRLNMQPFQAMLQQLRENLRGMGEQITQAWGQFWEDLVSGQDNAGRRLLASMIRIVADQLRLWALQLAGMAITRAALGDWGGAARAAAGAAGIAALSGVLSGLAARIEQSGQREQSARPQEVSTSRPQQAAPQPVVVGRPGGAQSPGQVTGRIEVEVRPPAGWVAREVKSAVRTNTGLRTVLAEA